MTDATRKMDEGFEVLNQISNDLKAIKNEMETVSKNVALTQRKILATYLLVGALFILFILFVYRGSVG